jgi:putative hydrolase of the HAD superfamily
MTQLFPDTIETLKTLRSRGIKIGVVTNGISEMQHNKLHYSGVDKLVDAVVVSGDLPFKKPGVEIFDYAAEKLGVRNDQVIFVGDHPKNDISGARKAGMNVVWMKHGLFKDETLEETASINKISEILDFV